MAPSSSILPSPPLNDSHEHNATLDASETTHQLKPTTTMAQAVDKSSQTKSWSKKMMKPLDKHPRSKAARKAWKRGNLAMQPGSTIQMEANNEGASVTSATTLAVAHVTSTDVAAQVEGGDIDRDDRFAPTTAVATSASARSATPAPASSPTPPIAIGQRTWRIIRLGPSPAPAPASARPQAISAPALRNTASAEKNISAKSKTGKENKASALVSAAPTRRSTRIMKKLPVKFRRDNHPGSSGSGQFVESTSAA
ncbi:hypothetical protein D9619_009092 [Psilocybe cf. subviscida]|uniref:Uncharacterized protein n=1 Tax=Psilocybe cf. subviscida TaxID=2480587 RepID=A0A8H5FAI2_9AGAR|nr:hypothetical protein D9619_009092 [Psilocybe cf. subviscida]